MGRTIPRQEWGSHGFLHPIAYIGPQRLVFRHHTVTIPLLDATEAKHMRFLEEVAYAREFWGLSYSFVIFPSGNRYEGRGWRRMGAHTDGYNHVAHGVAFAGNFMVDRVTDAAIRSYHELMREGVAGGHVLTPAIQHPHRAVKLTACPGNDLVRRGPDLDRYWVEGPTTKEDDVATAVKGSGDGTLYIWAGSVSFKHYDHRTWFEACKGYGLVKGTYDENVDDVPVIEIDQTALNLQHAAMDVRDVAKPSP